uniref:Uncharacterized protein n=1 Tax=Knipowitschia caucasica TaxID=637954 RepID=A0AAV2LJJ3_KNICA
MNPSKNCMVQYRSKLELGVVVVRSQGTSRRPMEASPTLVAVPGTEGRPAVNLPEHLCDGVLPPGETFQYRTEHVAWGR